MVEEASSSFGSMWVEASSVPVNQDTHPIGNQRTGLESLGTPEEDRRSIGVGVRVSWDEETSEPLSLLQHSACLRSQQGGSLGFKGADEFPDSDVARSCTWAPLDRRIEVQGHFDRTGIMPRG